MGPLGVEWCNGPFWVIDTAYYVTKNRRDLDLKYFYYLIKYVGLNHLKDGTSNPSLSRDTFNSQLLPLPTPREQKQIAGVLSCLDDKIDLNRRMNETLEAMARAIFKSWFVDFDPVRAKMDGCKQAGVDAETANLFPDSLDLSVLGPLPRGWGVGTINEATSLIIDHRGKTPKKMGRGWSRSGIPAISAKNLKNGQLVERHSMNLVDQELYDMWMKEKLRLGDILLTSEAPLGELYYLAIVAQYCLSQRVFALRTNPARFFSTYLYQYLCLPSTQERLHARATGTTVLGIRQSELRKVQVLIPPKALQERVDRILKPCRAKIATNHIESETLASIRTLLLPRLLSGEIRVKDAEKTVEALA
jgi:type I restriction enzyme S subunit